MGLTSIAVINLNHCREYSVEQEAKDDTPESLYPIDLSKVRVKFSFGRYFSFI